jgi:hypothetical protein
MLPLLLAAVASLAVPAGALAVEEEGRGTNVGHVKNIPYPNLHAEDEVNSGTDLEFLTITLPPAGTPQAAQTAPQRVAARRRAARRRAAQRAAERRCLRQARRRATRGGRRYRTSQRRRDARRCKSHARKVARRQARRSAAADAQPSVSGTQKTFAFAGSYGDGLHVMDVTNPEDVTRVATWDCGISQGDVQAFKRDDLDGRLFVVFTHDDGYDFHSDSQCAKDLTALGFKPEDVGGAGTYIAEVTDPYAPKTVSFIPIAQGSHNQTIHPSGRYLYNSNSDLITSPLPAVEIFDIRNLAQPESVGEIALMPFPGLGTEAHDIGFNAAGTRAYVAALSHGEILDTTDPANPVSIGKVIDPAINVWHETEEITIDDPILGERSFLIAEDEVAGALGTGQCPNGAVHVYDITGDLEQAPVKVGMWNISDVGPTENNDPARGTGALGTCTAHVFQLHRAEKLMTIAYYNGGVRVVDLSGLVGVALGENGIGMKELGYYRFADSDTWAAKAPFVDRKGFYFYGNDHARGFDVYRYQPGGMQKPSPGRWWSAREALGAAARMRADGRRPRLAALCLLTASPRSQVARAAARAGLSL